MSPKRLVILHLHRIPKLVILHSQDKHFILLHTHDELPIRSRKPRSQFLRNVLVNEDVPNLPRLSDNNRQTIFLALNRIPESDNAFVVSSFCIPINGNVMVVSRFYKSDIIALGIFLYRNYLSETGIASYGPYRNRLGFISIQWLGKSLFRIILRSTQAAAMTIRQTAPCSRSFVYQGADCISYRPGWF